MPNYHITRDDIKKYKGNPNGAIMPDYVGQLCIDELEKKYYISTNLNNNGWVASSEEIDVSNKQNITDNNLSTTDKTITGAINELKTKVDETFQEVDSGKTLIAAAIDDPSITKYSTFIAMSEAITNLKNQIGPALDATDILYNMMIEDGYNEANSSMTVDELIDLLDRSDINVSDIKQIACGMYHTFILKTDGSIWGCGNNGSGQLGLNDNTSRNTFTKVTINVNNDVKQIACGQYHSFILKNDGSVWSCGLNDAGQLGLGDTTSRSAFTKVTTNVSNVKEIVCGGSHTYILKNDGSLWACGYNGTGQLGSGSTGNYKTTFTKITTNINNDVKQVACGMYHTFILKNDGSVWACGISDKGQLGLGSTDNKSTFTQVTANINNDVKQIACSYYDTFLLKNDGSLWTTGINNYGELGLGDTSARTSFTKVTTNINNDVKQIACGDHFTYILKNDGSLWACGYNNNGQLGLGEYGSSANKTIFTQVTKTINNDVKEVACGGYHTFILKNDGSVWSCGSGNNGQLGLSINGTYITFTNTEFSTGLSESDIDKLALYNYLLSNEIPVTENMTIEFMLELLVFMSSGLGDGSTGSSSGGIDVVCATSLPETVVENQIVIITSNEPLVKEMRDYSNSTPTSNEEIIIGISTTKDNGAMVPYSTMINDTVLTLYLAIAKGKFYDKLETYNGYIGRDGGWLQFSVRSNVLYFNGYDAIEFTDTDRWSLSSNMYISSTSPALEFKMKAYSGGWQDEYAYFRDSIDLTNVREVRIVGSYTDNGGNTSAGVGFVKSSSFGMSYPEWEVKINLTSSVKEVFVDVSHLGGNHYFGTVNRSASSAKKALKITEFELIYDTI